MNTQQHKHGERVFCWSQSMFNSGSKAWGTVRQCSKYKWVDLDNSVGSNQNRVRYDRAYWYSQDDWDLECQQIREMRENDKRKEEEEKIKAAERYQEVTANLVKLTEIKVGQKIRFVSKYCPDMLDVYIVTEIRNNTIFGLDSDNREVSVGRVGEVYFAAEEPTDNTVVKAVKETKPQNKIAKLQAKLIRLEFQLKITKGNRAKAKIVIEILKIESAIEQLEPVQEVLGDLVIYKGINNTYQVTDIKSGFSTIYEADSPIGKLLHLRSFIQKAKRQDAVNSVKKSA